MAARVGRISWLGALAGTTCGSLIYAAFFLAGFAVLGAALILTLVTSRFGAARRPMDTIVEDERRGAANIVANCGVGTLGAVAALFASAAPGRWAEVTALWCVTAIAAGASDTVASEIGKAFGGIPRSFPTFQSVAPGTPGGITAVGTGVGICGAALIALPAVFMWLLPWTALLPIVIACTAGAFAESALATWFDRSGRRATNHVLNVANTAVAAATAIAWFYYGRP